MAVRARAQAVVTALFGLALWPGAAAAVTPPVAGAAAIPAGLTLHAPFPCGVTYRVICGYACGAWHKNVNEATKANDYYALDLARDEPGDGFDKPVTAVAAGTVRFAGWAGSGWDGYGQLVVLELDYKGDGHGYLVAYAHLNQIKVAVGQHVAARATVGTLGRSGFGSLTYNPAAHVQLAVYRDGSLATGGPYGGVATVPEPLDGAEDLVDGAKHQISCTAPPPDAGPPPDLGPPADLGRPPDLGQPPDTGSVEPDLTPVDGPPSPAGDLPPVADFSTGPPPPQPADAGCGCATGRSPLGLVLPILALVPLLLVRRRVRPPR